MRSTFPAGALADLLAHAAVGRAPGSSIPLATIPGHLATTARSARTGTTLTMIQTPAVTEHPWTARLQLADVPLVQAWLARLAPDDQVRIGAAPSGAGTSITVRCGHAMLRVVNPGHALAA